MVEFLTDPFCLIYISLIQVIALFQNLVIGAGGEFGVVGIVGYACDGNLPSFDGVLTISRLGIPIFDQSFSVTRNNLEFFLPLMS